MSNKPSSVPQLKKVFTLALFGECWEDYLQDAEATIKSICQQKTQDFIVDIAVDRSEAKVALAQAFKKFSKSGEATIEENRRLIFTDLPEDFADLPKGAANKEAAAIRFSKYMLDKDGPIRILFAADLDDIFPPDYNDKMTATINGGADVAIANQIAFKLGASDWCQGTSIQFPRFPRGHRFDLPQILNLNMAGFCNTAINLKSDVFEKYASKIIYAIANGTNEQPDRSGYAVAFAYGAYGELSEADMGYGQGNGFYGQNGTALESELNMQHILTEQLVGLDGLALKASQLITNRHEIDKDLMKINQSKGVLWRTYEMLAHEAKVKRYKQGGHHDQWGEQVLPSTRHEIRAAVPCYLMTQSKLA